MGATTKSRVLTGAVASLLMSLSLVAQSAGFDSTRQVLDFANRVMMDISQARLDDAWRQMKQHSNIPGYGIDNFGRQYRDHHEQTIRHYGPAVGVELMKTEMAGQSFLRATYLVKYEATAITWFMIFYKVRDTWVLNEFNYDILSNANFIVTSMEANTPTAPSLNQTWQREMETRLARIEQQGGMALPEEADTSPLPMIRSVQPRARPEADDSQTEARLSRLEARQEALERHRVALQEDGNISLASTDVGSSEALYLLRQIEDRLASLEEKYEVIVGQATTAPLGAGEDAHTADRLTSLELRLESLASRSQPGAAPDGGELARVWEIIDVLKKQHPFTKFPEH